jgi:citrate lyase beta subunit
MAAGKGTIDFEGKMIDGPLLKRAEDIVAMAEAIARREAAAR